MDIPPNGNNAELLQGVPVSPTAPTIGQILGFTGTAWSPQVAPVASIAGYTGAVTLADLVSGGVASQAWVQAQGYLTSAPSFALGSTIGGSPTVGDILTVGAGGVLAQSTLAGLGAVVAGGTVTQPTDTTVGLTFQRHAATSTANLISVIADAVSGSGSLLAVAANGNVNIGPTSGVSYLTINQSGRITWNNTAGYIDFVGAGTGNKFTIFPGNYNEIYLYSITGGITGQTYRDIASSAVVHYTFKSTAAFGAGATAGYTAYQFNITETGTPAGTRLAANWILGSSSIASIDASGSIKSASTVATGSGLTGARPTVTTTGAQWYDTTLGKPIWWNGSNWIDATGATV